jgi:hypothetical protein
MESVCYRSEGRLLLEEAGLDSAQGIDSMGCQTEERGPTMTDPRTEGWHDAAGSGTCNCGRVDEGGKLYPVCPIHGENPAYTAWKESQRTEGTPFTTDETKALVEGIENLTKRMETPSMTEGASPRTFEEWWNGLNWPERVGGEIAKQLVRNGWNAGMDAATAAAEERVKEAYERGLLDQTVGDQHTWEVAEAELTAAVAERDAAAARERRLREGYKRVIAECEQRAALPSRRKVDFIAIEDIARAALEGSE